MAKKTAEKAKKTKKPLTTAKKPPKGALTEEELGTVCGGGDSVSGQCVCGGAAFRQK